MGGAKKFLYTGPRKGRGDGDETEISWNFNNKNTSPRAPNNFNSSPISNKLGMEDVWSIKRDVNVSARQQKTDGLTFNANKTYYSRYGGMKDQDNSSAFSGQNHNSMNQGSSGMSWNMTSARRPFSYASFNSSETQQTPQKQNQPEPPMSSRHSFTNTNNYSQFGSNNTSNRSNFSSNNNSSNSQFSSRYKSPW